jgi:hypothetical protein
MGSVKATTILTNTVSDCPIPSEAEQVPLRSTSHLRLSD